MAALTPEDLAMLQTIRVAARDMILSLARTGSGKYNSAVERYQKAWNAGRPAIDKVPAVTFKQLATDGMYGKNTASTLYHVVSGVTAPPSRAYEIPAWYGANKSAIDSMASYAPPPTTVASQPAAASPTGPVSIPVPVPVQQPSVQPPVPIASASVPPPSSPPSGSPQVVSVVAEIVEPAEVPGVVVRNGVPVTPQPASVHTMPELTVYGKTPKNDVLFYALAAAGLAVAGIVGWQLSR